VSALPELLQRAVAQPDTLHWQCWASLAPGPSLVVLGAGHGNEVCGAHAIVRAIDDLTHGRLRLQRGRLTLVPVANPLAFAQNTREGERNLNRRFVPQAAPQDYEDRITRQLAPLLAQHDVLLDLHSFHTPGEPFAMVGPRDNNGAREPFARAAEEMALARALGAPQVVEGWLEVYDRAALARGGLPDDDGIGTNEYMRSQGGYAVTLECGQHEDPQAIEVAERAVHGALAHLGLAQVPAPARFVGAAARLNEVVLRQSADDRLVRDWHSFDTVQAGDVVGVRADGTPVQAARDGCVLFPHPEADVGQEWFYLAVPEQA
jgi:predicted deacylase